MDEWVPTKYFCDHLKQFEDHVLILKSMPLIKRSMQKSEPFFILFLFGLTYFKLM